MSAKNSACSVIILVVAVLLFWVIDSRAKTEEGIRIDLPENGNVKIDNPFGSVQVQIWQEKYVLVSAAVSQSQDSSPVVIDNRKELLSISAVHHPLERAAAIDLVVSLPASSHLELTTTSGAIKMRGLPAKATLRSTAGAVTVELPEVVNADVIARSNTGIVKTTLSTAVSSDGHLLQTRLGSATETLRINTESGAIDLSQQEVRPTASEAQLQPPRLADSASAPKAAGLPEDRSGDEEISEGDIIRVDSQLVTLNVSVIDRDTNRGLPGLSQTDFKMFEDGVEQRIVQFDASSAPFDLVLLLDISGSTKDKLELIRASALRFIEAARPSDRIAVIAFAGHPTLVSPLTLDRAGLRERVNGMQTAGGDTKLYDAEAFALDELQREGTKSRRTAIVLMSDGLDGSIPGVQGDGSQLAYNEVLSRVREFDGVVYTLWLNTEYEALNPLDTQPEAFDLGYDRMKEMADGGGGIFYEVDRLESLAGAYDHVIADLGTVYSLSYRPSNKARDGSWRAIKVNVERRHAVARGKRGYFAK